MANEQNKEYNTMLTNSKDMPKIFSSSTMLK